MRTLPPLLLAGTMMGWAPPLHAGAPEDEPARPDVEASAESDAEAEPESSAETETEPETEPIRTEIPRAILRVDGLPFAELRDALAPRLPEIELLPFDDAAFEAVGSEPFAYVEVVIDSGPDAEVSLTIVLSDQRAYLRRFVPEADRPLRSIVTTIANTIAAIEEERIEADQRAIAVPRPEPEPTEPEPVEPEPQPVEPEPQPVEPEPLPIEPLPEPVPPPYEFGVTLAAVPTFGLAPASVRAFAAMGGEARVGARLRRGALVELGLRISSRSREDHRLWRNRLSLTGGYAWRRERFGLAAAAGPTVEPWAVRRDGNPAELSGLSGAGASPLWGALVSVTPSLQWQPTALLRLSAGLRTELSTSVLGSGAAARVLAYEVGAPAPTSPSVVLTLGGVELSTALELTLWIAPPTSARATRARRPRSTPRWSRSEPR